MTGSIDIRDLTKFPVATVRRYHEAIVNTIRASMATRAVAMVRAQLMAVRPHAPFNTGEYSRNWRVTPVKDGSLLSNSTVQAGIIERGRRPGFGVSRAGIESLTRWVHLHGMDALTSAERRVHKERTRARIALARRLGAMTASSRADSRSGLRQAKDSKGQSVAWAIATNIKRYGLPAKNVLGGIRERLKNAVLSDVNDCLGRVA